MLEIVFVILGFVFLAGVALGFDIVTQDVSCESLTPNEFSQSEE